MAARKRGEGRGGLRRSGGRGDAPTRQRRGLSLPAGEVGGGTAALVLCRPCRGTHEWGPWSRFGPGHRRRGVPHDLGSHCRPAPTSPRVGRPTCPSPGADRRPGSWKRPFEESSAPAWSSPGHTRTGPRAASSTSARRRSIRARSPGGCPGSASPPVVGRRVDRTPPWWGERADLYSAPLSRGGRREPIPRPAGSAPGQCSAASRSWTEATARTSSQAASTSSTPIASSPGSRVEE